MIEVWAHAGQRRERAVLLDQVARFNAAHPDLQVRLTLIPEGSYNAQVQAAAVAGELPDLLEFDGPFLDRHLEVAMRGRFKRAWSKDGVMHC